MSPQENYRFLREINREANEIFPSAIVCSGSECCESNLLILNHDMKVIKKAARQGGI